MHIRHSAPGDIPRMMELYAQARRIMAENGNPNQWGPTCWPPRALIERDIRDKVLNAIYQEMGMSKKAKGIVFSLPVSDVAGLMPMIEEKTEENK